MILGPKDDTGIFICLLWSVLLQCSPPPHQPITRACIPQPQRLPGVPTSLQMSQLGFQPTSLFQPVSSDLPLRVRVTFLSMRQDMWPRQQEGSQESTLWFTRSVTQDQLCPSLRSSNLDLCSICSDLPTSGLPSRLSVFSLLQPLPLPPPWILLHTFKPSLQLSFLGVKSQC